MIVIVVMRLNRLGKVTTDRHMSVSEEVVEPDRPGLAPGQGVQWLPGLTSTPGRHFIREPRSSCVLPELAEAGNNQCCHLG